jgi:hypothetical protein
MTTLPLQRTTHRPSLAKLVTESCAEVVDVRVGSRPHTHRLTVSERLSQRPLFTAVTADRDEAVPAVEQEGRLLVELRRDDCGDAALVAPRHMGVAEHAGRPVLIASPVAGVPLGSTGRQPSRRDVGAVVEWLTALWDGSRQDRAPSELGAAALGVLLERHAFEPDRSGVLDRVSLARDRLSRVLVSRTISHGALSPDKVAVERDRVVGVEDWACGAVAGDPLRDLGSFVVACAGLQIDLLLTSRRSLATALRAAMRRGLTSLGVDGHLSDEVLVLAVAEHAAASDVGRRRAGLASLDTFLTFTEE